ncbi:YheV family putative zinc ribbon protein [Acinetobacter apis]|uniref:Metal-binding protein n=1 Tax=Acinetobacter apis TaxID=1229165 RepID=A0A217EFX8_9GAMM|nr:YheV family putative zinc ribbon protein [Acinetobacter apis]SNQ29375.1 hypothetical protein SAMN05444584_1326 [Acinetobacter apis]
MKKRFIAGVKCPKCNAIDRIVMFTDDGGNEHIECIECDYNDKRPTFADVTSAVAVQHTADDIGVIQFKPKSR